MSHAVLPYGRQLIEDDDVEAVVTCLRGDWLTTGPAVAAFEDEFCRVTGAAHAAACSSGTAALHLAAAVAGLGPGSRAIVPAMTFAATANCVRYVGGEVIFADVNAQSGLVETDNVLEALNRAGGEKVSALFVVHLNGHVANLPKLAALCAGKGLTLIEDACHALGANYTADGARHTVGDGAHGRLAAFSFHPVKAIAMGEGGMVTTADAVLDERIKRLRNHGIERNPARFTNKAMAFENGEQNPWYYELAELGWNYRASDINCALALSQLKKLERFLAKRRFLADRYDALLASYAPLIKPVPRPPGQVGGWHLYVVHIDFKKAGISRARLMRSLAANGIMTQVHYVPAHKHPYYQRRYGEQTLPGAETYYAHCLSLPLFAGMNEGDVDRVLKTLAQTIGT